MAEPTPRATLDEMRAQLASLPGPGFGEVLKAGAVEDGEEGACQQFGRDARLLPGRVQCTGEHAGEGLHVAGIDRLGKSLMLGAAYGP